MKILLDPIYTGLPNRCASNVKIKRIVTHLLETRDDIYFYWLYPEFADPESMEFYPDDPRVKLVEYPYSKDRMKEYVILDREYSKIVSFYGHFWDWDIIITNRTSFVPLIKQLANKPSRRQYIWSKRVFLIEDMPIMNFKKHVSICHPQASPAMTALGYALADDCIVSAFWEKPLILSESRNYLSPAMLKNVANMVESSAAEITEVNIKSKEQITAHKTSRPFTFSFVGRMTHNMKAEEIFDLMEKHWIFRGGENKIRCMANTQTVQRDPEDRIFGRVEVPSIIQIESRNREEFWGLMENDVDIFLYLTEEADYPMALIEALVAGTPAIVIDSRWSRPTLGDDYPFYVKSLLEAYVLMRKFYENYEELYEKFSQWSQNSFLPLLISRNETAPNLLFEKAIQAYEKDFDMFNSSPSSLDDNAVVVLLDEYARERGGEVVIFDAIKQLDKAGKIRHLAEKTLDSIVEKKRRNWLTDWNLFRLGLMRKGYVDHGIQVGRLRLVNEN